jgi:hypothetical protein
MGSEWNILKLSSNVLLYQGVTGFSPRFHEQGVRFGPTVDRAGLDAIRAGGLTTSEGKGAPGRAVLSHRKASTKLSRSRTTPCRLAAASKVGGVRSGIMRFDDTG